MMDSIRENVPFGMNVKSEQYPKLQKFVAFFKYQCL
jgi:hypothetical protein